MKESWKSLVHKINSIFDFLKNIRKKINQRMMKQYRPVSLALAGTLVCFVFSVFILLVPSYLGMANDTLGNLKMQQYGLGYRDIDVDDDFVSNEYFIRTFVLTGNQRIFSSSQNIFVSIAKAMDNLFTHDNYFDLRFLAVVYLILYLPAVFLILRSAIERVPFFSEGVLISIIGTLIFSDISYIAYFNSLYSDALIFICILYVAGASMSLHLKRKGNISAMLIMTIATIILCTIEKRFMLSGMLISVLMLSQLRIAEATHEKVIESVLAVLIIGFSVFSFISCDEEFDETSKLHAMTRGVLFQSEKPDQVLENMGIDVSYTTLTDVSLYDYYPVAEIENIYLQKGFLDKYKMTDIVAYYIRHPKAMVAMWDIGIKASLNLRRDYCSNYEKSVGMPAMGKSLFWSVWSSTKERAVPKTIGYVAVLIIAFWAMSGKGVFNKKHLTRWNYMYFVTMLTLIAVGIVDISYVIVASGDAQFVQYNMTLGVIMDILLYYVVAEILHKLGIMEGENDK